MSSPKHSPNSLLKNLQSAAWGHAASTNTGEIFATRAGAFRASPEGFLTTYDGCRIQGEWEHQPIDLQVGGNLSHPGMIDPLLAVTGWAFDWAGQLLLRQSDGTSLAGGKLVLMQFAHPETLLIYTNGVFRIPPTATPVSSAREKGSNQRKV